MTRRLPIQIRDLRPQLRLCLRVTVATLVSFVLGNSLNIPFGGQWAVLTAVVVTQMSVGGSLNSCSQFQILPAKESLSYCQRKRIYEFWP
jgi:uncharacterized membrane protein YccC